MVIRRQVETHVPGLMPRAAPTRNQIRALDLKVETLADGMLRVSTPLARGWAAVARNPFELARAIQAAFTEAQMASYARWKGEAYELDLATDVVPGDALAAAVRSTEFKHRTRSDTHSPADWCPMPDGRWRSPSGRAYRPDTPIVRNVVSARVRLGIPVRSEDL